mmetsp:Transcript_64407/g.179093  ORF Transcript_64407/g.179093 Transcript_64407/m.179093 type:complete len:236 (+) Transcript_64407:642-1349(+)
MSEFAEPPLHANRSAHSCPSTPGSPCLHSLAAILGLGRAGHLPRSTTRSKPTRSVAINEVTMSQHTQRRGRASTGEASTSIMTSAILTASGKYINGERSSASSTSKLQSTVDEELDGDAIPTTVAFAAQLAERHSEPIIGWTSVASSAPAADRSVSPSSSGPIECRVSWPRLTTAVATLSLSSGLGGPASGQSAVVSFGASALDLVANRAIGESPTILGLATASSLDACSRIACM